MDFNPIDGGGSPGSPHSYTWTQQDRDLFDQIMNEAGPSSSAAPEETVYDVSFSVPEKFTQGSQAAPGRMVERLGHLGLLPDSDQPTMTYEIRGHRYTAALSPSDGVRLIHNPPEDQRIGTGPAGLPDFGAFILEARRRGFPLPEQWAPPALIEKLRETGFMPTANNPTTIAIDGRTYKAELTEGGFVRLRRSG
ncbi:hypothetical protein MTX26_28600 [Bradyrhizobium sp. ISRA443]|uniref:hypothetical protein n=1 Tax=unclassified Bradyrhizobium TaxID=2631580 RepID=UPI0024798594|nr:MULTISPECIES: hypothetical protein [unclassified Bradyrhizobium]WGR98187.1 hypothetical protein MTX23_28590 [Bradyrhizobium sp. ISRA436]WGS05076.1 hypothetical protein MTX18_28605 [Bradyrhizobium sp. ISRA437]WGS11961.1 hypothetical protein MTX26_28600 [Bradyrhizobium sp. ISRA443]